MPARKNTPPEATTTPLPPSVRITGDQAKKLHGVRPGQKVKITITGPLLNVGMNQWDKAPSATIQIDRVQRNVKRKK